MSGCVKAYKISTGEIETLGCAAVILEVRISGNFVVWREGPANLTKVMLFDLAWLGTSNGAIEIAGPTPPTYGVDIGDRFAVFSHRDGIQQDIGIYDLVTGLLNT